MPSLQALYLQDNAVTRVSAVHGMPHLTLLNLASNPIFSWASVTPIALLSFLQRLDLSGCPVEKAERSVCIQKAFHRNIPIVMNRNKHFADIIRPP